MFLGNFDIVVVFTFPLQLHLCGKPQRRCSQCTVMFPRAVVTCLELHLTKFLPCSLENVLNEVSSGALDVMSQEQGLELFARTGLGTFSVFSGTAQVAHRFVVFSRNINGGEFTGTVQTGE
jgi:hypothetical protein